ncbi:MAG: peptidoglycan-binding protein [Candidatus Omnitrophica bacterium]|nr:peptidoglycan-binding protein [Candidatus Omnitrophota bacterium]
MGRLRERVERVDPPRVEQGRAAARGPAGHGGPTVADIQRALQRAGYYDGPVDGTAGPRTTRAIKAFQRARGLSVDGKVGPKTWAALSPYRSSSDTHGGSR